VRGSYTCYRPGQYSTLADHIAKPAGNIFFAGEHTSEFAGFMEGGVESGERVADDILKKLGRRPVHARAA
jgi:monoamine oxidase